MIIGVTIHWKNWVCWSNSFVVHSEILYWYCKTMKVRIQMSIDFVKHAVMLYNVETFFYCHLSILLYKSAKCIQHVWHGTLVQPHILLKSFALREMSRGPERERMRVGRGADDSCLEWSTGFLISYSINASSFSIGWIPDGFFWTETLLLFLTLLSNVVSKSVCIGEQRGSDLLQQRLLCSTPITRILDSSVC